MKLYKSLHNLVTKLRLLAGKKGSPILVALDGRSGSGKSTLANQLAEQFDNSVVIQSDDFYCGGPDEQWEGRTPKEKVDHCIDWRRLRAQVLEPLLAGKGAAWHPFDFQTWSGLATKLLTAGPTQVMVLDGAYSARPELSDLIDLTVLVESPDAARRARLVKREDADYMEQWHKVWDEAEDYYFTHVRPPESFDLVIPN